MNVQYRPGQGPVIWAATRRGDATDIVGGINVSYLDMDDMADTTNDWVKLPATSVLSDIRVWNFAFDGDRIYIASDSGLFSSPEPGSTFVRIDINSTDPETEIRLGASVNGVAVLDSSLWVATDDGFARRSLSDVFFDVFQVIDDTTLEAYAFPTPFNPTDQNVVRFHYQVPVGASSASIAVYDFAMNLVKQVTTNTSRLSGEVVHGNVSDNWNGLNGQGELVAPGIYYFKVEFSNGDNAWGKLAVIP